MRRQPFDLRPEQLAVVHVPDMRDLVGGEIIEHEGRRENEPPREIQRARGGAGSPAADGVAHGDATRGDDDGGRVTLHRRLEIGARYQTLLQDLPVERLALRADRDCVWAQFTLQLDNRSAVQQALHLAGIPTAIHYPTPLHQQPAYARYGAGQSFPHAERAAQRVMSLPMSADLSESQQDLVLQALRQALAA